MNPFNRPNDTPEDPTMDMSSKPYPLAELNPASRSPATNAENPKQLATPQEIMDMKETGGPQDMVTPPGGKTMTDDSYKPAKTATSTGMQYSSESGNNYKGHEVHGKVIHNAKTSDLGDLYE